MAGIQIHLLQHQVLGVVQRRSRAPASVVLGGSGACRWHLGLYAAGRPLRCQPLLLLQLKLGLYTIQVIELFLLYKSLLLLVLRREDALVVLENQDFVLILLWDASCHAHIIRGQAIGHANRS